MKEYDKYTKPIMDELNQKFKFFTKVDDNTYLVQSKKDSYCEAYFVTLTDNCHIIMSGDYDGIMVHPYGNANCLPNWMAGATTISYFAEKVINANRHHQIKEWREEIARKEIEQHIIDYYSEPETNEELVQYKTFKITEKAKEFLESLSFDWSDGEFGRHQMYEQISEFDSNGDWAEHDFGMDYTHQFKWQHKCLVFWANKVLEGAFDNDDYYIVCATEKSFEGTALFWKPDNKGYTSDINQAGLYTKEDAEKTENDTHKDNVAVQKSKILEYFNVYTIAGFGKLFELKR